MKKKKKKSPKEGPDQVIKLQAIQKDHIKKMDTTAILMGLAMVSLNEKFGLKIFIHQAPMARLTS
jgi:hypothetical protein